MYLIREDELVGYSRWPWDEAYTPVVGLFANGRLAAHAFCELERPAYMPVVSHALAARARRKLSGVRIRPVPIDLEGPAAACWFRLQPGPELLERIRAGDRSVHLARLEDGARLHAADAAQAPAAPRGRRTVEDILDRDPEIDQPRDGYADFLRTPRTQQLDIVFIELLRRLPDPDARRGYLPQLEHGQISLTDLRRMVMGSEEFANRRVGPNDRIGAVMTSPLWRDILQWETPGADHRSARPFRLADHAEESDEAFIHTVYRTFLRRDPDPQGQAHYLQLLQARGRRDVAAELGRWSAGDGRHFEIV